MKRYISLALAAVVLICSFAVPSYAAEVDNPPFLNLLDYVSPNVYTVSNLKPLFDVPLPYTSTMFYVDAVVTITGSKPSSVTGSIVLNNQVQYSNTFSLVQISGNLYRLYGSLNGLAGNTLRFSFVTQTSYVTVHKLGVYTVDQYYFETSAHGSGSVKVSNDLNIGFNYNDLPSSQTFSSPEDFNNTNFTTYFDFPNWKSFDSIDICLYYRVRSITSITAVCGDLALPITVSFLNPDSIGDTYYYFSVTIDLSQIDRSYSDPIELSVYGNLEYDRVNAIAIVSCSGYVDPSIPNPIFTWFSKLINNLDGWFSSLGDRIVNAINGDSSSAADQFKDQIDQSNQDLDDMSSVMNSFTTPDINSINVDVGSFVSPSDISSLTVPMSLLFESNIVITCIMISIILATVMFVLYGKR